jgi:hypothetical protein
MSLTRFWLMAVKSKRWINNVRLGLPFSTIPQNTRGKQHKCGSCTFGCPNGVKQSSGLGFNHYILSANLVGRCAG